MNRCIICGKFHEAGSLMYSVKYPVTGRLKPDEYPGTKICTRASPKNYYEVIITRGVLTAPL